MADLAQLLTPLSASDLQPLVDAGAEAGAKRAAQLVRRMLDDLARRATPGTTTRELDFHAHRELQAAGAVPSFLGYKGFPAVLWASPNEFLHALPDDRRLSEGDLLTLDLGAVVDGWHADIADTIVVGHQPKHSELIEAARVVLEAVASVAWPGRRVGKLGYAALHAAANIGCCLIPGYLGHGVGREMHASPAIPLTWDASEGPRLEPGMILAIEPAVTFGAGRIHIGSDGWSAQTEDKAPVAMIERMILITEAKPIIL